MRLAGSWRTHTMAWHAASGWRLGVARALIQYIPSGLLKTAPRSLYLMHGWSSKIFFATCRFMTTRKSYGNGLHGNLGNSEWRERSYSYTMPSGLLKAATHSLYMMHGWSSKTFFATCRFMTKSYEWHAWEPGRLGVARALMLCLQAS